ncbi:glycosyltransferase [Candidatus Pelagibacter sp.]|uniref:glycosyltransferase family 2 protein n=1 Tax=Candidatus Pelagibacter sp. TaxID=2024849 RepID=UPI003F8414E9
MLKNNNINSSVIIANYNNSKYLTDCFNSILNQTYKNIEIIFIDDGSTDNSLEVFKKYQHQIKQVKKNRPKTGIPSFDQTLSYFECIKNSSGDIIHFCDSDDFFVENKIEIITEEFSKNKNYSLIFDLPILKFENNSIFTKKKKKFFKNHWPYFPPTSCISIKKDKLIDFFGFISNQDYPDIWLDFRLGILSQYIFREYNVLEKNLTFYRQINSSISSKFNYLSKNWWLRRKQAHDYVKYFLHKNNLKYKKNFDFYLTKIFYEILK